MILIGLLIFPGGLGSGSREGARKQKASRGNRGKPFESKLSTDYGLGLDVVVVVLVELDEFGVVAVVVFVLVVSFVSFVFSFSVVGFTTVVLFSTFFSGPGELAVVGATTVLSSHPPRSAAVAKMQISFFISFGLIAHLGTILNRTARSFRPCRTATFAGSCAPSSPPSRGAYNGALYFNPCASATAS